MVTGADAAAIPQGLRNLGALPGVGMGARRRACEGGFGGVGRTATTARPRSGPSRVATALGEDSLHVRRNQRHEATRKATTHS